MQGMLSLCGNFFCSDVNTQKCGGGVKEMRNKLFGVFALLAVLLLTACNDSEHENIEVDYSVESENSTQMDSTERQAEGEAHIFGAWIYVKTIIGDDGEPHQISEFTFSPPRVNIYEDNTISAIFWETSINAVMIKISDYEFLVAEQFAFNEGEQWHPEDVMLLYDAESGLLRWTFFNPFSDVFYHHFFARSHPFAVALCEYMGGYDGAVRAFLVTLDDNGTIGVLATKTPEWVLFDYDLQEYNYSSVATLFFMEGDNLHQFDASGLFASGRYNRLMNRLYAHTHTVEFIYIIENGQLQPTTRLEFFDDDYLLYLFEGDHEAVAERVVHRTATRESYGLDPILCNNPWLMEGIQDQTIQILAMTINCALNLLASKLQTTFTTPIRVHPDMPEFTFTRTVEISDKTNNYRFPTYDVVITVFDESGNFIQGIDGLIQETTPYNSISDSIMESRLGAAWGMGAFLAVGHRDRPVCAKPAVKI